MFGSSKPTFGTGTGATGFGTFNNAATTTPFGQSAFGKPATPAFGAAPAFGTQAATPSMFGTTAPAASTGLFGGATTSGAFGSTTTAPTTFGGFSQTPQNSNIFGTAQNTTNTSLFGQTAAPAFGAAKPAGLGLTAFGQTAAAQPTTSLFGQQPTATSTAGFGTFGQAAPTSTNVFGSGTASAFGQPQTAVGAASTGTSLVKYQPTIGTDTLMKGGQPNSVNTKQHCITAMKEYELKSLEELRMEDYLSGRRGPQAGAAPGAFGFGTTATGTQPAATGLFGASTQPATGLFGQTAPTENKTLFGQTPFGQQTATTAFGAPAQQNSFLQKPFGTPATNAFGTPADASNPFGTKPAFGQTSNLFGQTPATSTAPAFGQSTPGFGGFGTTAGAQQSSLFGATNPADPNKPAFGLGTTAAAPTTGFGGFGSPATSTAGGGLFAAKPATSFAPTFGATSTANTGFGNFSLNNTAATAGGLFNSSLNKPATTGFGGFGTQTSTAPLNFTAGNTSNTLFGTTPKPAGLFGGTGTLGAGTGTTGGIFSGTFGGTSGLGGGFGFGGNTALSGGLTSSPLQQQQLPVPIHQQILAKVTSPYGDTPIFKDLKRPDDVDAARATNPAAQKAVLDLNSNQFKINNKDKSVTLKVKSLSQDSKSLFDGLEEYDGSVEGFVLKPSFKRLVFKSKESSIAAGNADNSANNSSSSIINSNNNTPTAIQTKNRSPNQETFSGVISVEQKGYSPSAQAVSANAADQDTSRRESWLRPINLERVRQHNLQAGMEANVSPNSTLSELVPRKPIETYRPSAAARVSISTIAESPYKEQSTSITRRDTVAFSLEQGNDSVLSNRSLSGVGGGSAQEVGLGNEEPDIVYDPHPTGIVLRRVGYYTIPSLDDLKSYLAEDGSCVVPNFTVGREGYGNVYFGKELDVAGLNLDEIVHFRNKEIIIYPDDDNKPSIGSGLNRDAQVTLDQVWPHDKTKHEPIKDAERLAEMDWEGKLRRVCDKNDTRFIEYRPETGSWVFRVKHFSKYGLNDSDEDEEEPPSDAKKAKMAAATTQRAGIAPINATSVVDKMTLTSLHNAQKISEEAARMMDPKALSSSFRPMDDSTEFVLMDKTQFFQAGNSEFTMFEPPRSITSPTAILAKDVVGSEPHKVQLMKSTLFVDEIPVEDMDVPRSKPSVRFSCQPTQALLNKSSQRWKSGPASDYSSSHDDFEHISPALPISSSASVVSLVNEMESETSSVVAEKTVCPAKQLTEERKPITFKVRPKVAPIKLLATAVPLSKSIAFGQFDHWVADLGFYRGHSFKTSFGPQNLMILPNTFNNLRDTKEMNTDVMPTLEIFKLRSASDFSTDVLQIVQLNSVDAYPNFAESIVPHLKIELCYSVFEKVEGSECPWLHAKAGAEVIVKHLAEAIKLASSSSTESYFVSVWSLMLALWGNHEEMSDHHPDSHFVVMCRRNLLSEWLENTLVTKDLLEKKINSSSYLEHMLDLLYCHRVTEACELAFDYDNAFLSLILAQLSSGPVVRLLLDSQLFAWQQSKSDKYISIQHLKMYMLGAGVPLMNSEQGIINLLEDQNWITVLALQLWYFTSPTSSITDSLIAYDTAFKGEECYAKEPNPNYKNTRYTNNKPVYDLRYHLLKLYSERTHSMENLLSPETHTPDPMDFRLSWLLLQTLDAQGYKHCSALTEAQLHVNLASQLENEGLWEWSIFVLLHIKQRNQRERAVQQTLQRHVSVSAEVELNEQEFFIIDKLRVPECWVDYAKAVKAGASGQRHLQAKYLLRAKQWVLAHEVIFQDIASDAIINGKTEYLAELLNQFECTEEGTNIKVPNWANQGQIFLDFIDVITKFKQIRKVSNAADIHARWENLKPQLSDLCSRISLMPCPTPKHRLCQSEISQSLSCLVHGICIVCPNLEPCAILKMALERLPLPQEFSTKDLRSLLDQLLDKINR